jgi:hypothetical protein
VNALNGQTIFMGTFASQQQKPALVTLSNGHHRFTPAPAKEQSDNLRWFSARL